MKAEEINPYVRFVAHRSGAMAYNDFLCAYDHRAFFVLSGEILFEFEKTKKLVLPQGIIVIPPEVPYKLTFFEKSRADYYIINFDFEFDLLEQMPKSPQKKDEFNTKKVFSRKHPDVFDGVVHVADCAHIEELIKKINAASYEEKLSKQKQSALLKLALIEVMCRLDGAKKQTPQDEIIDKVKQFINKNSHLALTNELVAQRFNYHPYYLSTLFVKQEGASLHKYIVKARIARAKQMLASSSFSVAQIAQELSFKDASYFSAFFLREAGLTPRAYREQIK